jgi:TnpA family transposase
VPVEFLTDEQAASYGRFPVGLTPTELEGLFFLDDFDRDLVARRRGAENRIGFGLQVATVRSLGTFLADPLDVPTEAVDYVAEQVGAADPSVVKGYLRREKTRFEHQWEIARAYSYTDFAVAEPDLIRWVDDQAWTSGDGPKALLDAAVGWLRERKVLLPAVSTLARLVAQVRGQATDRLHERLSALVSADQARLLEGLLDVPEGSRFSQLERLRTPVTRTSGTGMVRALQRAGEVAGLGLGGLDVGVVPRRRVWELARYGLEAKAPTLRRHPYSRKLATILATVRALEARSVDDALELFDVLMTTQLLSRAERQSKKEKLRRYPKVSRHAGKLAAAVAVLLEAVEWGEQVRLQQVWDAIENVVSRAELRAAVAGIAEILPPADADTDGEWRAHLVERMATIRGFVPLLCQVIEFGATADAAPVLYAVNGLPELLDARLGRKVAAGFLDARRIQVEVVPSGWRQRLVFPKDRPEGTVDRAAYVFCVLEQFHQRLKRRDIFAAVSERWGDPRARLLDGDAWQQAKAPALNALQLPEEPRELLDAHAAALDEAWRTVAAGLSVDTAARLDDEGRLHAQKVTAIPDPPSLVDLRRRVEAMLPRIDLGELVLEVMAWYPGFASAFTALSGAATRLDDLHVTIAATLTAHALNVGFVPVISDGVPALTRGRISHVDATYLRPETYAAANGVLIAAQDGIGLARAWGGGLVAAADGMRLVVPVRTVHARPNPKYFGQRRGATWLNMVNDQAVGTAGRVLSGTPRDSMHLIDLLYRRDGGRRPEVVITDTGSYSDVVFGLLQLLGFDYRPQLADLPDAKLWRINRTADYGPLDATARGIVDLDRIARHRPDMLRIAGSIHTGQVPAYDVLRVLSAGGNLTQLGEALAGYGRIFKTLHVLTFVDDEPYRRQIKGMRNLNEGRHDLARHVFHGRRGELHRAYHEGMEDQLGALGLVLNCITLWNTLYLDLALAGLRAQGYPVLDADVARLSPYVRHHIRVHGHYTFTLPDLGGRTYRPLRNLDAGDDE